MKLGLILTNDWELFGDGSGDFYDLQYNPLNELLDILPKYNAKITIMAEVAQQLAFRESDIEYHQKCAREWEAILHKTILSGSDVQLHYHPQWIGAKFENNKWQLNLDYWKLSSLDYEKMIDKLSESKNYLETLLKTANDDYLCRIFRAGSYCIQPSETPIKVLKEIGITADSSVTKNYKNPGFFDYSKAHSNLLPYKTSKNEIGRNGKGGLIEFPIYSEYKSHSEIIKKISKQLYYNLFHLINVPNDEIFWQEEKDRIKNEKYPKSQRYYKKNEGKNLKWYLSKFCQKSAIQLDYDNLPATVFVNMIKKIIEDYSEEDRIIPVVASGHLKDIHNLENIKKILEKIKIDLNEEVIYWTFSDCLNYWENKI